MRVMQLLRELLLPWTTFFHPSFNLCQVMYQELPNRAMRMCMSKCVPVLHLNYEYLHHHHHFMNFFKKQQYSIISYKRIISLLLSQK